MYVGIWINYVILDEDSIFIFGGSYKEGAKQDKCFVFQFSQRSLSTKASMNQARSHHCGYKVENFVYVFGGWHIKTAEMYAID
jgi:hypothetical protein